MPDEDEETGETGWGCVVPFLNPDPAYCYGVEFGRLYEQMKQSDSIDDSFHTENQDQILLLFSRLGWTVGKMDVIDEHWFHIEATAP